MRVAHFPKNQSVGRCLEALDWGAGGESRQVILDRNGAGGGGHCRAHQIADLVSSKSISSQPDVEEAGPKLRQSYLQKGSESPRARFVVKGDEIAPADRLFEKRLNASGLELPSPQSGFLGSEPAEGFPFRVRRRPQAQSVPVLLAHAAPLWVKPALSLAGEANSQPGRQVRAHPFK